MNADEVQRRQRNAAREELRRLVSYRKPPSKVQPAAFGPWAEVITTLRATFLAEGADACRQQFLETVKEQPELGVLLATDPERRKTSWTWADLQKTDFPDPVWVVPDLIPAGLVTIGGRPKIGKSWLALQIACAVGTGGQVFGRQVSQGKVLYLALEDSPRRLKMRAQKQLWPAEVDVTFDTEWPTLGAGGTAALRARIEQDGYTLVIVDTLTRALGGADQMDLAETAQTVGELQRLSQELDVTVLLLDHHRKPNGFNPDPVDDLFGSTGKAQPLDGVCGLYRERGKKEALLRVTGRDVEEVDLALVFDGLTCTWTLAQKPGEAKTNSAPAAVLAAIRDLTAAGELAYGSRIARKLGRDPSNVGRAIAELLREGLIREGERQGNIVPLLLAGEEKTPEVRPLGERVTWLPNLAAFPHTTQDCVRDQVTGRGEGPDLTGLPDLSGRRETPEVAQRAQEPQRPREPQDDVAARPAVKSTSRAPTNPETNQRMAARSMDSPPGRRIADDGGAGRDVT